MSVVSIAVQEMMWVETQGPMQCKQSKRQRGKCDMKKVPAQSSILFPKSSVSQGLAGCLELSCCQVTETNVRYDWNYVQFQSLCCGEEPVLWRIGGVSG